MSSKILIPKTLKYESCSEESSSECVRATPGRKRKLDHLSYEEKVQRKKLKNRVAAQTSRDRKKKQMDEMQVTIEEQCQTICNLERRCEQISCERDKIAAKYEKLEREHQKLKARSNYARQESRNTIPEEHKYTRSALEDTSDEGCIGSFTIKTEGSAESKPLLKVSKMEIESIKRSSKVPRSKSEVKALLKVILLCLLYRNSSKLSSSASTTLSSLQKACSKMSHQTWKQLVQQASQQMPKAKAMNSQCLNSWWGPQTREWNPPKIEVA
jgi:X box-binding protein 1